MPRLVALLALGSVVGCAATGTPPAGGGTICSNYPKICAGTWNCTCPDGQPGGCGDAIGSTMSCSMFLYSAGLSGTIPTEIGLYKNMMRNGYLELFGNRLSGTIPTELSHWRGYCDVWESQAPLHWTDGTIDNPNRWECPIRATGSCVRGVSCSYWGAGRGPPPGRPPSPPLPPTPPLPPATPPPECPPPPSPAPPPPPPPSSAMEAQSAEPSQGIKTPILFVIIAAPSFVGLALLLVLYRRCSGEADRLGKAIRARASSIGLPPPKFENVEKPSLAMTAIPAKNNAPTREEGV